MVLFLEAASDGHVVKHTPTPCAEHMDAGSGSCGCQPQGVVGGPLPGSSLWLFLSGGMWVVGCSAVLWQGLPQPAVSMEKRCGISMSLRPGVLPWPAARLGQSNH